jgi:hypothetical protein
MDNSPIKFLEDTHQYINIETNEEYCSVSKLLGRYKEKFDAENISKWVAKKRGVSQEEILKEWEDNKNFACDRGTDFHAALENYVKYGEVDPLYKKIIEKFQLKVEKYIPNISEVYSEKLLYNHDFKIAGTGDLLFELEDGTFIIGDFKTNKKFRFGSDYGKWMKAPLNHLSECEFNTYALQLGIYGFMNEILTKKKCKGLLIFWLDMNTGNWEVIPTNFMKHEIILMLNHYKKNINTPQ